MDKINFCKLSQNDYDYVWFANQLFLIENEINTFQFYENLVYAFFILIVLVCAILIHSAKLRQSGWGKLLLASGTIAFLLGVALLNQFDKVLADNYAQARSSEKRMATYNKPAPNILQLCVAGKGKPKAKLEYTISENKGTAPSSAIVKN